MKGGPHSQSTTADSQNNRSDNQNGNLSSQNHLGHYNFDDQQQIGIRGVNPESNLNL